MILLIAGVYATPYDAGYPFLPRKSESSASSVFNFFQMAEFAFALLNTASCLRHKQTYDTFCPDVIHLTRQ